MTNKTWLFMLAPRWVASYLSAKHCPPFDGNVVPATRIHKHCRDIAPEMRNCRECWEKWLEEEAKE